VLASGGCWKSAFLTYDLGSFSWCSWGISFTSETGGTSVWICSLSCVVSRSGASIWCGGGRARAGLGKTLPREVGSPGAGHGIKVELKDMCSAFKFLQTWREGERGFVLKFW
nr:hypothetical protein [Tanacetum cinerariifolium]